jgi:hypothetical protein
MSQRLDDDTYQAALGRLRAYREQLERAEREADQESLDRAADLATVYADKRWVDDLPPLVKTHNRGRPVEKDSFNRFTKWVMGDPTANIGIQTRHSYQLHRAHEVANYLRPAQINPGSSEKVLRPLSRLLKDNHGDEAPDVWRRAKQLADGAPLTFDLVTRALRDHNKALGRTPPTRAQAYQARTVRDAWKRLFREFDYIAINADEDQLKAGLAEFQQRLEDLERARTQPA